MNYTATYAVQAKTIKPTNMAVNMNSESVHCPTLATTQAFSRFINSFTALTIVLLS